MPDGWILAGTNTITLLMLGHSLHLLCWPRCTIVSRLRSRVTLLKRIVPVGLLLLSLTSISITQKRESEPDPIMPDVTARGRALYEYDEAAWHASDALQAAHPATVSLGRYIAHKSDSGWTVAFGHLNEQRDKRKGGLTCTSPHSCSWGRRT